MARDKWSQEGEVSDGVRLMNVWINNRIHAVPDVKDKNVVLL